jgi:hypothetical protein
MRAVNLATSHRHRLSRWIPLIAGLAIGAPTATHAFSIQISSLASGYLCTQTVPPFTMSTIYISASLNPLYPTDPSIPGITSAVFKLGGFDNPAILFLQAQPAPGAMLEGNPVGVDGCRVSFPTCQNWAGHECSVPLLQVTFFALQEILPTTFTIEAAAHVCQAMVPGPFVTGCEDTTTHLCATGIGVCINNPIYCPYCPLAAANVDCEIAVTPASWSSVKRLYKE